MSQAITRRHGLALVAGLVPLAKPALAQPAFPNRPIRLIVPWLPSAAADIELRSLAQAATRVLSQSVVIENRAGASGILGAQAVANETRGDGYLLTQLHASAFRVPFMMAKAPYDVLTDFTPVLQLVGYSYGMVVRADSPWKSWADFVADAKARPGKITFGTAGVGTTQHITMEAVSQKLGLDWVHVPFRGGGDDVQALLGGQLDAVASSTLWAELVRTGQLRLLVSFGPERIKRFPEAPTLRDCGIDIAQSSPYGLVGPKGIDPGVVRVLHDAFHKALLDPEHLAVIERLDMPVAYLDTAAYAASIPQTQTEQRNIVRALGLKM